MKRNIILLSFIITILLVEIIVMSGCPSPQTSIEITTLEKTVMEETIVITTEEEVKEETAIASTNEEAERGMLAYVKDGNIYIKDLPNGQVK